MGRARRGQQPDQPHGEQRSEQRSGQRGHRVVPHTADVILEAWGPDLPACLEQAVAGLVAVCVDGSAARSAARQRVHLAPAADDDLLLDLLEEVIFTFDTAAEVPVAAEVHAAPDGGLDVELVLADPASVVATGAVPKAVSRSELSVSAEPGQVRCRFLVDV